MKAHIRKPTQKTILTYGLSAARQQELVRRFEAKKISCRAVQNEQTGDTLAQLFEEETPPVQSNAPQPGGSFAVLDGFEGKDAANAACVINSVCAGVIKAVRTKHNDGWHFYALCEELAAEHAAMTGGEPLT